MRRPRGSGGGTLIEMLVAIGIFLVATGAMFVLFQKGYQSFHFLEQRQSLQSQVLRITGALEADFRLTHFNSVGIDQDQTTVGSGTEPRDRVSCLGVDDWGNSANFSTGTGIPRWNQYAVYIATREEMGRLERVVFEPAGGALGSGLPVAPLGPMANLDPDRVQSRQMLCENVLAWDCWLEPTRLMVNQVLRLRKKGGRRGLDDMAAEESFEARFRWVPKNTVPRL